MISESKKNSIICSFYPVYMLIYFFLMFDIHLTTYIGLPIVILVSLFSVGYMMKFLLSTHKNTGVRLMLIWSLYNLLSIVMYAINGLPLDCYIHGLRVYFFSTMFFYIGANECDIGDNFYNWFLASCGFFFIVGLYLYIVTPSYYVNYMLQARQNTEWLDSQFVDENNIMSFLRFSSFMPSSYISSALSVSCVTTAFAYLFRKKEISNILFYVLALLGILGAVLCQQRIAMACVVIALVVYAIYGCRKNNKTILLILVSFIGCFVFLSALSFSNERFGEISDMILNRLEAMNFKTAMDARSGQYERAMDEIYKYFVFGKGMGAGGHSATAHGAIGIHDGEFYHFALEFGLVGLMVFIALIANSLYRGMKNFSAYTIETCIIVYLLLSCIGENALSQSYLIGPIFWFSLGRIWNDYYFDRRLTILR